MVLTAQGASAGEAVIFSRLTDGYWQVWAMNTDGSNPKQITDSKLDKRDPVCMDNGKKILFRTNNGQLMVKNLALIEEAEVLSKYNLINNPAFCDAKDKVLFVRFDPRATDISDIWTSDLDGNDPRILTKDKRLKYQPVFNRSCDQIAFVKADDDGKSHHLWVMSDNGENMRQVTEGSGFDVLPDFLPGDQGLVFSSNRVGKDYEIYQVDFNAKAVTPLTDNEFLDTSPAVSADGKRILFVSTRSGSQQVWVMNTDGTESGQLTNGDAEALDPQWCLAGGGKL